MSSHEFGHKLVAWYQQNHRSLPWRATTDPYKIWLSEIILQQTRVAQGLPYYERFVKRFPTIFDFAAAPEKDILHLWQGLGYYSRARNMHATAQVVVEDHKGKFPSSFQELLKLKGIGDYTASAIASFAFNEQVPVVDGNVFRVLARYYGIYNDIANASSRAVFKEAALASIPPGEASVFNQAIMEFGALMCTPVAPTCESCPVSSTCFAYHKQAQSTLPVKSKKTKVRERHIHYLVITDGERYALRERTNRDIWQGLYDFLSIETADTKTEWITQLPSGIDPSSLTRLAGPFKHILSHQRLQLSFWKATLHPSAALPDTLTWYSQDEIDGLPKPLPINLFLNDFL